MADVPDVPDRLDRLAAAAEALAGELDVEAVLDVITATAAHVTGARYAALGVIGGDGTIERFITYGVTDEQIRRIGAYPTGKGILGLLIREPRIIRLDDIQTHPASYGFPPHHPPMTTFLGAPVRMGGRNYGNLYLTEKQGGFDATDERLLLVLAAQAGAAIENALLSERLQELAVLQERDRISRELHDGVIQSLFSIGMGLESARSLIDRDTERVATRLDTAVDAIDATIRELRNYIFRLRPHKAATLGLERGLVELAREYAVNTLVNPRLEIPRGLDAHVPEVLVADVVQLVREALSNVAKHANAHAVVIRARLERGDLLVEVADDGAGFSPDHAAIGRGLENMRERAQVLSARLDIDSRPGGGTTVRLLVPIDDDERT